MLGELSECDGLVRAGNGSGFVTRVKSAAKPAQPLVRPFKGNSVYHGSRVNVPERLCEPKVRRLL